MKKVIITLITLLACASVGMAQSAIEIVTKVKNRPNGDTRSAQMVMKLVNKRGRERVRKLQSYSIDCGVDKKDSKTVMFFVYPGDVKGTAFLTWDYDQANKADDKWLYLPAMKKNRRISGSSAKKDYFMGSDFTYDDMGSRSVDEDTHKLLGEEVIDGQKCWKLEATSKDKHDLSSRKVSWIRQDNYVPVRVDYYDKRNKLHRQLKFSNVHKVGNYWSIGLMKMVNVQTKHQTIIQINNQKFDLPLKESQFNVNALDKGRL